MTKTYNVRIIRKQYIEYKIVAEDVIQAAKEARELARYDDEESWETDYITVDDIWDEYPQCQPTNTDS